VIVDVQLGCNRSFNYLKERSIVMSVKIYTKPSFDQLPLECVKWPRCAIVASRRPEIAWTNIVSEETMFSKSAMVPTTVDKVWELIGDPDKIPVFDEGVVEIDWIDESTFKVKDVYRTGDGPWKTQIFTTKVVKKEPPRLIQYEMGREGHKEVFTFSLEEGKEKDTAVFTLRFNGNFAVANPREVEILLEKICFNVARMAIDNKVFTKMVKEFRPKEQTKIRDMTAEQKVVG
jgi:hypothetical protein